MPRRRSPGTAGVEALISPARTLAVAAARLKFGPPVTCVYNPLAYAWRAHEQYLRAYGAPPKRVVFLGMNPGPFGMVQTEREAKREHRTRRIPCSGWAKHLVA